MAPAKSTVNSNTMPATPKKTAAKPAAKTEVTVPVAAPAPAPVAAPVPAPAAPAAAPATEARSADAILASVQEALKSLNTEVTGRVRALIAEATEAAKAVKRSVRDSKRRVRKDPATMTADEKAAAALARGPAGRPPPSRPWRWCASGSSSRSCAAPA